VIHSVWWWPRKDYGEAKELYLSGITRTEPAMDATIKTATCPHCNRKVELESSYNECACEMIAFNLFGQKLKTHADAQAIELGFDN